jgi:hypothetical protein
VCKPIPPLPPVAHESYNCVNNQCAKQPLGQKGAFANLTDCQQVGHCGVASAWNILEFFVTAMTPNSAATYTLGGKDQRGQCQGFDMGSFGSDSAMTVDQGKQLTLTADNGCGGVVLDALHKGSFFKVGSQSSASLVLQGLTLRNGLGVRKGASYGGAVHVIDGTLTTKDCRLEHCTASIGGAIALGSTFYNISKMCSAVLHATNTTFFNNSGDGPGGSIWSLGTANISNCTFSESTSAGAPGGALSVCTSATDIISNCNTTITNSTFENCSSNAPGGALNLFGSATITGSTFTGCTCGGAPGGAVAIGDGDFTFTNCIFADNTCLNCDSGPPGANVGGAIWPYFYGPGGCTDCTNFTLMLEGCKFVVPVNAFAGNNDLYTGNSANDGSTTFACPPGTKGTPVTVANGPYLTKQLPPSTEIVHCV